MNKEQKELCRSRAFRINRLGQDRHFDYWTLNDINNFVIFGISLPPKRFEE